MHKSRSTKKSNVGVDVARRGAAAHAATGTNTVLVQSTLEQLWRIPLHGDAVSKSKVIDPPTPAAEITTSAPSRSGNGRIVCVDLFCGCGGWSTGAVQAGHKVVLAIDADPTALQVHRLNHPTCAHACMKLGRHNEERLTQLIRAQLSDGDLLHVHGSPPCQSFSAMRNLTTGRAPNIGMKMVEWYIQFIQKLQPHTWSMEQVCMRIIREYLTTQNICFHEFEFELYGVPQTRRRILAGTPSMIVMLRDDPKYKSSAPASPATTLNCPRRAKYVRASGGRKPPASATTQHEDGTYTNSKARWARDIHQPTWTLLTPTKPVWLDERYKTIRVFTRRELCKIQTLPENYKFRLCRETDAVRLIGNCVPPLIAQKMMDARWSIDTN